MQRALFKKSGSIGRCFLIRGAAASIINVPAYRYGGARLCLRG